jgi:hypothetical protein
VLNPPTCWDDVFYLGLNEWIEGENYKSLYLQVGVWFHLQYLEN